jgi:hypothetical protein
MTAAPRCVRKGAAVPCLRCAECRVAAKDARIAALFGMPPPAAAGGAPKAAKAKKRDFLAEIVGPCIHRGRPTGETTPPCKACGNTTEPIPLAACSLHTQCTERFVADDRGIPCCRLCTSREESAPSALPSQSRPLV